MNKLAESFFENIKKLAAYQKPSPWDFRAVPFDDKARMSAYYTGPGTVGALGGTTNIQPRQSPKLSKGWIDSLRKKLGG